MSGVEFATMTTSSHQDKEFSINICVHHDGEFKKGRFKGKNLLYYGCGKQAYFYDLQSSTITYELLRDIVYSICEKPPARLQYGVPNMNLEDGLRNLEDENEIGDFVMHARACTKYLDLYVDHEVITEPTIIEEEKDDSDDYESEDEDSDAASLEHVSDDDDEVRNARITNQTFREKRINQDKVYISELLEAEGVPRPVHAESSGVESEPPSVQKNSATSSRGGGRGRGRGRRGSRGLSYETYRKLSVGGPVFNGMSTGGLSVMGPKRGGPSMPMPSQAVKPTYMWKKPTMITPTSLDRERIAKRLHVEGQHTEKISEALFNHSPVTSLSQPHWNPPPPVQSQSTQPSPVQSQCTPPPPLQSQASPSRGKRLKEVKIENIRQSHRLKMTTWKKASEAYKLSGEGVVDIE